MSGCLISSWKKIDLKGEKKNEKTFDRKIKKREKLWKHENTFLFENMLALAFYNFHVFNPLISMLKSVNKEEIREFIAKTAPTAMKKGIYQQ